MPRHDDNIPRPGNTRRRIHFHYYLSPIDPYNKHPTWLDVIGALALSASAKVQNAPYRCTSDFETLPLLSSYFFVLSLLYFPTALYIISVVLIFELK